ncbi:DUF1345 domain-containing protein [Methylobrevis albus]|uniref:DUF1345 domain-containing protein n=1 Tax=Methylobrevis albus TaxID=2793297 RepID=A0A931MYI7_9HYPH|nr:DUF1345 domain-containing protein [Methylobrevis albus]MBH0238030.1 DUF1345 domain-containing protein [Methylobrevis albus]
MAFPRSLLIGVLGFRRRRRLLAAVAIGLVAGAGLPAMTPLSAIEGALLGWNLGVAAYLGLVVQLFLATDVAGIRRRAAAEDEGAVALLLFGVGATLASIAAIVALLAGGSASGVVGWHFALAVTTILAAWGFVHTVFAVHYAHEYYAAAPERDGASDVGGQAPATEAGGLDFPGGDAPDYLDFLYFSVVVGATAQTADIATTTRRMRRIVLVHGVLAFFFNTTILALMVNIGAGLL